ncbi:SDR family NAD(P)-dependent oxidoreductase [Lacticaseibacillus pabuli]|uniref:SDR family NAD(P)-dependent oxidoreductase n=1 Tax=Lacticaseibacillus pabuli TaxID=3025672 RepID=A0ABY7WU74_9LACO|nr:SDR family NAD(P)-dependent oxidoreductase [Lacticaseibacillus sp. KACC 23028]WDF83727.1 SDR family NAD(P)-dependent oxidoreductase [Lacticaseibacillus sp. KACC 23028]
MSANEVLTLITGSDKGIGFETAKELAKAGQHVLIGARNQVRGESAVQAIREAGGQADFVQLDVTNADQVQAAAKQIQADYGHLNVLINNAGIAADAHQKPSELSIDLIQQDFAVNFFGLIRVTQAMVPLLRAGQPAKIINVTSNMGSFGLATDPNSRFYQVSSLGYQASKAAANFATVDFAKELADEGITVNSVNPGWTATGFGGRDESKPAIPGMQSVAEGAAQIIKLALSTDQTTGTFTENAGKLPW